MRLDRCLMKRRIKELPSSQSYKPLIAAPQEHLFRGPLTVLLVIQGSTQNPRRTKKIAKRFVTIVVACVARNQMSVKDYGFVASWLLQNPEQLQQLLDLAGRSSRPAWALRWLRTR